MARCHRKVFAGCVGGRERCSNVSRAHLPTALRRRDRSSRLEVDWPVVLLGSGLRSASDKGFWSITAATYLELFDWTARQARGDRYGDHKELRRNEFDNWLGSSDWSPVRLPGEG